MQRCRPILIQMYLRLVTVLIANLMQDILHLAHVPKLQANRPAFLVDAMAARLNGRSQPMFTFNDKGSLVSLSRHKAVGELLGDVSVQGYIAKTMYVSLYRLHQATIHGYTQAGLLTMKDLLTRRVRPKIKLY